MVEIRKTKSILRKLVAGTVTLCITGLVIAIAGTTIWQGTAVISSRAAAVEKPKATNPIAVSVARIELSDGYKVERSFTGQIEALQTASMSFELGGALSAVLVDEGDTFKAGDVLARLDDRMLKADVSRLIASKDALKAQLELAELTDKRRADLKAKGFASAQTADQTRLSVVELNARFAEIDASILAAQIQLEKTEIRAPFDGRVNDRLIDPGNTVGATQPILTLVDDGAPVFRVGVNPQLATQLTTGDAINVLLAGKQYQANIVSILPQIDPVTRTRIIRAKLADGVDLAFGTAGTVKLMDRVEAEGSWIPLTAIEDGVRGLWTIKTIRDGEPATVGIEAIELLYADSESAYVRGTFSRKTDYIVEGVHRVVEGQTVRVAQ